MKLRRTLYLIFGIGFTIFGVFLDYARVFGGYEILEMSCRMWQIIGALYLILFEVK